MGDARGIRHRVRRRRCPLADLMGAELRRRVRPVLRQCAPALVTTGAGIDPHMAGMQTGFVLAPVLARFFQT
ncbi:hypothetical protein [Actinopolymorpha alba]|uniref:hypothetical protein n=1 Tax=Actinopolymorpha alba TaxID=533267 RepID=UPI0003A817AC|nr:hypothetical protein [Actinopolymorpha alba]